VTLFKGIVSLRVPRFPLLHIIGVFLLASLFLVITGFVTSWTYLRFYKPAFPDLETSQPSSLRGDASETFAFAEFFPDAVKPSVAAVANQIYDLLVSMRICTPFSQADVSARGDTFNMQRSSGAPSGARAEAERRRALALKALDQRLHAATAVSKAPPPPAAAGPSVQVQPQPSQPAMLGETSYVPETEDEKS
jgi:hypothetical protein